MRRAALITTALLAIVTAARSQAPAEPPTGDPAAGEALFYDRCAMCHLAEGGGQGPSLAGLYGRRAASAPGFAYSDALKRSGLSWTGPALDRFLADPGAAVPGTAMPLLTPNPKERADLISFFAAGYKP